MHWRRLRPGELDHELIWLIVTVGATLIGVFWLQTGLPTPRCVWHEVTGLPCIGCGSTRCVRAVLAGDWLRAFLFNPLTFTTFTLVVLYDVYAAIVLAFRLPRLRIDRWPSWTGWTVRSLVVVLLLANWAWLIARGL